MFYKFVHVTSRHKTLMILSAFVQGICQGFCGAIISPYFEVWRVPRFQISFHLGVCWLVACEGYGLLESVDLVQTRRGSSLGKGVSSGFSGLVLALQIMFRHRVFKDFLGHWRVWGCIPIHPFARVSFGLWCLSPKKLTRVPCQDFIQPWISPPAPTFSVALGSLGGNWRKASEFGEDWKQLTGEEYRQRNFADVKVVQVGQSGGSTFVLNRVNF